LLIETRNITLDADSIVGKEIDAGQYVKLEVTDTGSGISDDVIDTLFEPFVSTKSATRGTGLGLAMVYGFVKQSGGEINVYSEANIGTTFTIYFPVANEFTDGEGQVPGQVEQSSVANKRILVVEDDDRVRKLSIKRLKSLGHSVLEAVDGQQGLQIFSNQHKQIDCVFTDVVMKQGMSGYDLASGKLADSGLSLLRKPYGQQDLKVALTNVLEQQ